MPDITAPQDLLNKFHAHMAACPLIAILRGITADEIDAVADIVIAAGINIIEVPLNSPNAFESIERLAQRHGKAALVGAGTVLTEDDVSRVAASGGELIVSPNTNPSVIAKTAAIGMISLPGFFTPSEAFSAIEAGAHGLKLFPAEGASPTFLKAQRAVLPKDMPVLAVGGITPHSVAAWKQAGADGFGLGSGLYRPGKSLDALAADASAYVAAVKV